MTEERLALTMQRFVQIILSEIIEYEDEKHVAEP